MDKQKNRKSVIGSGLLTIMFTLMLASTASAYFVGDFVWYDLNENGKQEPDEPGVPGVIVRVYDCEGNLLENRTTTTDAAGWYRIMLGLTVPEDFCLEFVLPEEIVSTYTFTVKDAGDDTVDSDADSAGKTDCFTWPDSTIHCIDDFDAGIVKIKEEQPPCGECKSGVTELTLRYTGDTPARIEVYEGKSAKASKKLFVGEVDPGGEFTFAGISKDLKMGTEISIWVDGVFNTTIHTSCSQPIGPGLVRGDFVVIDGYSKDGGKLCPMPEVPGCGECKGKVTRLKLRYEGTTTADTITIFQKKGITVVDGGGNGIEPGDEFIIAGLDKDGTLGTEIQIHVDNDPTPTKIHTSCSQPIGPGMQFGPFVIVEGYSLKGGRLCPVELKQTCGCEGKVTQLTLQYNGTSTQRVVILQRKDDDPVFNDDVAPGEQITFQGHDKNGTLGTEISVYVGGQLHTKIHTSCSQPIGPGLVYGDFEVIEGYSLKGGLLCPFGNDGDDRDKDHGDKHKKDHDD